MNLKPYNVALVEFCATILFTSVVVFGMLAMLVFCS